MNKKNIVSYLDKLKKETDNKQVINNLLYYKNILEKTNIKYFLTTIKSDKVFYNEWINCFHRIFYINEEANRNEMLTVMNNIIRFIENYE